MAKAGQRRRSNGARTSNDAVGSRGISKMSGADFEAWRGFYRAALIGVLAAQTKAPHPATITKWCVMLADSAFQECQRRHRHPSGD